MTKHMVPIGVFDSGVGGLTVLKAIRDLLPYQDLLYVADQAHVPYGERPLEAVRMLSEEITRFLLHQGAGLIVVACNTASAAALKYLRSRFEQVRFVGMEPAVKPAAETTKSKKVGVLATPATFQGDLYASVVGRFAKDVTLYQDTCPGLVQAIESGKLAGRGTRAILEKALKPMLQHGIDTVVLGCTHYPMVIPLIRDICGPDVHVIDPAPAVARQAARLARDVGILSSNQINMGRMIFYTSGKLEQFRFQVEKMIGTHENCREVHWVEGKLSDIKPR
jgi:glutamate racemase